MDATEITNIANNEEVIAAKERICWIGRLLFERHLTDAGGGNISVRVGDVLCMSPTYSGANYQWHLEPDDILVTDFDRNILVGEGEITREINVHIGLHRHFGDYGTAVIHAHPRNLMVFAALARPMPPVLEATLKFGVTPIVEYAPAHSPKLADRIVATMRGRESRISKHGAGTIAPWHGLFLIGRNLDAAFDAVERLDTNAYCIMMGQMMGGSPMLAQESAQLNEAIANFKEDA